MSRRISLAVLIALLAGCSTSTLPPSEGAAIPVPAGEPPTLDGTLAPGEWDGAAVEAFADGSELFLMASGGALYLGVRRGEPGTTGANVFVDRGGQVAILHTSAALGTAVYEREGDMWQQIQDFDWRCRRTDDSAAAQAERDAFLQEEGWMAANARTGTPNELEYRITVPDGTLRLAVVLIPASAPDAKTPWPTDLADDSVAPTPGGMPTQMAFSLEQWATVVLPTQ